MPSPTVDKLEEELKDLCPFQDYMDTYNGIGPLVLDMEIPVENIKAFAEILLQLAEVLK